MSSIIRRGTAVGLAVAACAWIAGCDDSYLDQSPGALPAADLQRHARRDGEARHHAVLADAHPHLQEGGGARNLENEVERRICAAQDLSDVPMVGAARAEEARRRHAGAGGLLFDRARADEPQFPLLSGVQRRLSERLRPGLWPHRRQCHGARRLLVRRLLLDDRRAGRRHLCDRARIRSRRPARNPAPVLSVPHDGREHGEVPARSRTSTSGKTSRTAPTTSRSPRPSRRSWSAASAMSSARRRRTRCPAASRARRSSATRSSRRWSRRRRDKDDAKVAELAASGVKPIRLVYADGGQNPVFAGYKDESDPDALATGAAGDRSRASGRSRPPAAVKIAVADAEKKRRRERGARARRGRGGAARPGHGRGHPGAREPIRRHAGRFDRRGQERPEMAASRRQRAAPPPVDGAAADPDQPTLGGRRCRRVAMTCIWRRCIPRRPRRRGRTPLRSQSDDARPPQQPRVGSPA